MQRKAIYFGNTSSIYGVGNKTKMSNIAKCYPQETDWTCSLACLRTLLSGSRYTVPSEELLVQLLNKQPGPVSSNDLLKSKIFTLIDREDVQLAYDKPITYDYANELISLLETHNIMIACTLNGGHWLSVLGYVSLGSIEEDQIILYDPYYHSTRMFRADEIFSMWTGSFPDSLDGDYIAIKRSDSKC